MNNLTKTNKAKSLQFTAAVLGFLLLGVGLHSCSKSQDTPTAGNTQLTIDISGVNNPVSNQGKLASLALNTGEQGDKGDVIYKESIQQHDFIVDLVSQQQNIAVDFGSEQQNLSTETYGPQKLAATSKMKTGVKYRILLYNKETGQREISTLAIAGKPLTIDVVKGHNFKWYAYSYNSTEDIVDPNTASPTLTTPTDKPLLYASGEINPKAGNNLLPITFNHKLTQLNVNVHSRNYFGDILALNGQFVDDYVKTSTFNLLTGKKEGALTPVHIANMKFVNDDEGSIREKVASYYTADENLNKYSVKITQLDIEHPNKAVENLVPKLPNGGIVTFDNFTTTNAGYVLQGQLRLWLVLPRKTILHYGTSSPIRGYEAQSGSHSGYFLRDPRNFGPTSNYFKIQGFNHIEVKASSGNMARALANPANYPDVLICGMFDGMNAQDYAAVERYVKKGGSIFLLSESSDKDLTNFFKSLYNNTQITLSRHDAGGAVYKLLQGDPDVTDGPFGDIRGAYWGQDRSSTQYTFNLNPNDIVLYSAASVNYKSPNGYNAATMFRHKSLNVFFIGDTGFLASTQKDSGGTDNSNTGYPFATTGGFGVNKYFPTTKSYGSRSQAGATESRSAGQWQVSNAIIFGNALAWILERAHFDPVQRN